MDSQSLWVILYNDMKNFNQSGLFLVIKIMLGIYVVVLFVDIVLLLIKRGVSGNMREMFLGMDIPREITSKKSLMQKKWQEIKGKLASENGNDYKLAVIEADSLIDDFVRRLGYKGETFGERLDNIPDNQIVNIGGMKEAHEVRNQIVHDENFVLTREETEHVLGHFEELLRSFQILD